MPQHPLLSGNHHPVLSYCQTRYYTADEQLTQTGTSCSLLTASNALVTTNNVDLEVQHMQLARDHSNTFCVSCAIFT